MNLFVLHDALRDLRMSCKRISSERSLQTGRLQLPQTDRSPHVIRKALTLSYQLTIFSFFMRSLDKVKGALLCLSNAD